MQYFQIQRPVCLIQDTYLNVVGLQPVGKLRKQGSPQLVLLEIGQPSASLVLAQHMHYPKKNINILIMNCSFLNEKYAMIQYILTKPILLTQELGYALSKYAIARLALFGTNGTTLQNIPLLPGKSFNKLRSGQKSTFLD